MPRPTKKKKRAQKPKNLSLQHFFQREQTAKVIFLLRGVKRDLRKEIELSCNRFSVDNPDILPSLMLN